jgi:hypothetical protein
MIEVVNAFLSGDRGECSSIEQGSEQAALCRAKINLGLCPVDIQYFRIVGKSHRYHNSDLQRASRHRVS